MIGGSDHIFPVADPAVALDLAVRLVRRLWPAAVVEDGETGRAFNSDAGVSFPGGRQEILAFRDSAASAAWEKLGACPATDDTLIHLIAVSTVGELTAVLDDVPGPDQLRFLEALRDGLRERVLT